MNFYTFFAILVLYYLYGDDAMISKFKMWVKRIPKKIKIVIGGMSSFLIVYGFINVIIDNSKYIIPECKVELKSVDYDGTFNIENASTSKIAIPIKIIQSKSNCIKSLEVYSTTFNDYTSTKITNNGEVEDFLISQSVQNYHDVDLIYLLKSNEYDITETTVKPNNFEKKELYMSMLNIPSVDFNGDSLKSVNNANRNIINHYFISVEYNDKVETYLYMYKETLSGETEVYLENINNVRKTDINRFITSNSENMMCLDISEPNFDISITKDNYCVFESSTYSNVDELYKERMIQKNVDTTDDGISITWYGDDMSDEINQKLNVSFIDSYVEMIIEELDNLDNKK